jgi:hypothetical protein
MRTEDRVIPDLLCGRDEHLVRDTEATELRGRQDAAATHRAASVAYAATGAALTGWPGGTCGYRPISARSHRRVASPQPSTTLRTPWVAGQDVEPGEDGVFQIARKTARDRVISMSP